MLSSNRAEATVKVTLKNRQGGQEEKCTFNSMDEADQYAAQTNAEIVGWKFFD